ncbi:MAG: VWA domain-containing protein, partial [Planctomycetaceae bacterium]
MSMSRKSASGTMFETAKQRAAQIVDGLSSDEDVRILTTAPYPTWAEATTVQGDRRNRARIAKQLEALEATEGRSDLLAALFTAVQVEHDPTQGARRIVVLTDGQAADWRAEDEAGWKRLQEVLQETSIHTEIETVRLDQSHGSSGAGNLAVDRVAIDRLVVGIEWPVEAMATLHNYGPNEIDSAELIWQIDGHPQDRQTLATIEGEQTLAAKWRHTFEEPGTYRISCLIDRSDDLPADNTASLVVEVVDRIPIVIVDGAIELAEMQQDGYFVQAALGWIDGQPLSASSIYVPTLVSADALSTIDLSQQRVVVIPNLTRLPEDAVRVLTQFVSEGGGLWIGLGPRTDIDSFNHQLFADASGLAPLRIDRIVDTAQASADLDSEALKVTSHQTRIDPFRSDHPATRRLADNEQLDLASTQIRRHFRFATSQDASRMSVLVHLNDGTPLAVENFVGAGRVIVQAVPLRLQWSDLARTQSFVVMVRDWVDYLAEPRATQYNLEPGQPIVYRLSESDIGRGNDTAGDTAPTGLLQTPRRESIELTAQPREDAMEFRSSRTRLPGPYRLEIGLAERVVPYQVMRSPEESNLASLDAGVWQRIEASLATQPPAERLAQADSTQAHPIWPYLLIALIAFQTGELVLSGVMARERFGSAGIPEFSEIGASPLVNETAVPNSSPRQLEAEVR